MSGNIVKMNMREIAKPSMIQDEQTIYVDDDAPPDWYDETHVRTIQEGIDAGSDGDTIFIHNGIYQPSTNIHVYKEVTIIGESKEGVIVEHLDLKNYRLGQKM